MSETPYEWREDVLWIGDLTFASVHQRSYDLWGVKILNLGDLTLSVAFGDHMSREDAVACMEILADGFIAAAKLAKIGEKA